MHDLRTNRDLYLAIENLTQEHRLCTRSLEQYLLALLRAAESFADSDSLSLNDFFGIISQAFTSDLKEFDPNWRTQYADLPHELSDFTGWRAVLIRQVVDLREMDENGTFANELRYFGVDSPRKSRWFNFDPVGYIECAMAGSFGGWEPGDETDRQFVPGPVAVLADDGSIQDANPEVIPRRQFEMPFVTWEEFKDFIYCGQYYE